MVSIETFIIGGCSHYLGLQPFFWGRRPLPGHQPLFGAAAKDSNELYLFTATMFDFNGGDSEAGWGDDSGF